MQRVFHHRLRTGYESHRIIQKTFFSLTACSLKKINDVSVVILLRFISRRGFGENHRSSASLLHRSVERFRFFACLGVRSRHTHGRRYDRFPGITDTSEGRPGVPDWPNTTIDQGEAQTKRTQRPLIGFNE